MRDADFSISYIFAIGELLRKWKDEQPHYLSLSQHFERQLLALIGLLFPALVLAKETIFAPLVEGGCFPLLFVEWCDNLSVVLPVTVGGCPS